MDIRHVDEPIFLAPSQTAPPTAMSGCGRPPALPDEPLLHAAVLAFASDYSLLEAVLRRHGIAWSTPGSRSRASTTRCGSTARPAPTTGCCTATTARPRPARAAWSRGRCSTAPGGWWRRSPRRAWSGSRRPRAPRGVVTARARARRDAGAAGGAVAGSPGRACSSCRTVAGCGAPGCAGPAATSRRPASRCCSPAAPRSGSGGPTGGSAGRTSASPPRRPTRWTRSSRRTGGPAPSGSRSPAAAGWDAPAPPCRCSRSWPASARTTPSGGSGSGTTPARRRPRGSDGGCARRPAACPGPSRPGLVHLFEPRLGCGAWRSRCSRRCSTIGPSADGRRPGGRCAGPAARLPRPRAAGRDRRAGRCPAGRGSTSGPGWVSDSAELFTRLVERVPWEEEKRLMYDRVVDVPRLLSWYGEHQAVAGPAARAGPGRAGRPLRRRRARAVRVGRDVLLPRRARRGRLARRPHRPQPPRGRHGGDRVLRRPAGPAAAPGGRRGEPALHGSATGTCW